MRRIDRHVSAFLATVWLSLCATVTAQTRPYIDAYACAGMPRFIQNLDLKTPVAIDTSISRLPGIVIRELQGQRRLYQKESWKNTGHVGSSVRDAQGAIYVAPIPSIALDTNPLDKRNRIYKVHSGSGDIEVFVDLPKPAEQTQSNPFGTLGLAIDCQTNSLYVSSVAHSTPAQVAGIIYQLDLTTGKVLSRFNGVDALSLAVFNSPKGKQLYYGDARSSNLYSVRLRNDGGFTKGQAPQRQLSLLEQKNGDSTQIRKIRFKADPSGRLAMVLDDTEFAYRPAAETMRRYKKYFFILMPETNHWRLMSIQSQ